jgi:hypothetical protein
MLKNVSLFPFFQENREKYFRAKSISPEFLLTNRKMRGTVSSSCSAQMGKKIQGSLLKYLNRIQC